MPVVKSIVDFSSDSEYLAYSSPDGCLKIWETSTNILKQEYTPSSHLSATCSAISWCPKKHVLHPSKRHKKAKDDEDFATVRDLQLIAIGTLTGDILLYSYVRADLYSCLTNGHNSIVNDICWCTSTCSLYSCSNDKNIIIWDVFTGKVKMKWKADNVAVHSICVLDCNNLLSASHLIKWWNIKKKTVLKTFMGHASEVIRLIPLKNDDKFENSYFLSAAVGDRVINAWQLNYESKKSVASFVVPDEPETLSVSAAENEPLLLSVVCKNGSLHLFEHVLNGYMKKPMHPKLSIQIASKRNEAKPDKVHILCATISLGLNSSLISYGNFLKPVFERIDLSGSSNDLFLIRDLSMSSISQKDAVTKIKHTDKSGKVKLLAPGHLAPSKNATNLIRKRRKNEFFDEELPMEERLRALDLSKIPPNLEEQEPVLRADSMVHLLLQGLQSKDSNMINTVLQSGDELVIQNTIKRLPIQCIILLLKELQDRLSRKEQRYHPYIKWMKFLLSAHLPYLMSCKDIGEYLGPINQLIQARIENFHKMCQLHGCLKILLSQTAVKKSERSENDQPLAVYQSDSSEESDSEDTDHDVNASDDELANNVSSEENSSSSESSEDDEMVS